MSPASASGLLTTAPPGKPTQPQAEGLIKAKDTAGSGWDERSRGRSGQYLVGKLFLRCGLWAYCSKADCQEHPAPSKPGGNAQFVGCPLLLSWRLCCQPWVLSTRLLRSAAQRSPCSPASPGDQGQSRTRPPGRELAVLETSSPVCPQGQKPVRQLLTSVQELGWTPAVRCNCFFLGRLTRGKLAVTRSLTNQGEQKGQKAWPPLHRVVMVRFPLLSWLRMLILLPACSAEGRNRGKSLFQETGGTERYKWGIFLFK